MTPAEQFEGLRQRSLALVCEPPPRDDPDLLSHPVLQDPMLLALPIGHPLATKEELTPADLHEQEWIITGGQPDQVNKRDDFLAQCGDAGFTPRLALEATDPLGVLGLVSAGLGLAMVQGSLKASAGPSVALRRLDWFRPSVRLWAAWHRVDLRPIVGIFRERVLALADKA